MTGAHSLPLRLIVVAIFISTIANTAVKAFLTANELSSWVQMSDIVLNCLFAYFIHWAILNKAKDIRLVLSIPATEINLKKVLVFSLKLMALTSIAVLLPLIIITVCAPFLEDTVLRDQTYDTVKMIYTVFFAIFVGAAVGYWGTWLPATVAGRNMGFKAAAARGKAYFARNASLIAAITLAQMILLLIIKTAFFSLVPRYYPDLNIPFFEDIRAMAVFDLITGIFNFSAYAAIAVILCHSYQAGESAIPQRPVPAE